MSIENTPISQPDSLASSDDAKGAATGMFDLSLIRDDSPFGRHRDRPSWAEVLVAAFPSDDVELNVPGASKKACLLRVCHRGRRTRSLGILMGPARSWSINETKSRAKFCAQVEELGFDAGIMVVEEESFRISGPRELNGVFVCHEQHVVLVAQLCKTGLLMFSALLDRQGIPGESPRLKDFLSGPLFQMASRKVCKEYMRSMRQSTVLGRFGYEEPPFDAEKSLLQFYSSMVVLGWDALDS